MMSLARDPSYQQISWVLGKFDREERVMAKWFGLRESEARTVTACAMNAARMFKAATMSRTKDEPTYEQIAIACQKLQSPVGIKKVFDCRDSEVEYIIHCLKVAERKFIEADEKIKSRRVS